MSELKFIVIKYVEDYKIAVKKTEGELKYSQAFELSERRANVLISSAKYANSDS